MKLKIVSDLHLEFSYIDIPNNGADVLVLSGDILVALYLKKPVSTVEGIPEESNKVKFRKFLSTVSTNFKHVVYVAGNHEFYNGAWYNTIDVLKNECSNYPNIHYLENESIEIDGVTFVGSTLWTDLNKKDPITTTVISSLLNDYRVIRNDRYGYRRINPSDVTARFDASLQYITDTVNANPSGKFVIVGHHAPSFQSIHPQYADNLHMSGAYSSSLDEFILDHPQIQLWTCGHNHYAHQYYIGSTLVVCNPRGYDSTDKHGFHYGENTGWDINQIIDLESLPTL